MEGGLEGVLMRLRVRPKTESMPISLLKKIFHIKQYIGVNILTNTANE